MTADEIYQLIRLNKCCVVQLNDMGGHIVHEVGASSPEAVIQELTEIIPVFKSCRKLQVKAIEKKGTPWTRGFCWSMEYEKAEGAAAQLTGAIPAGQISPMDYVNTVVGMMKEQNTMQLSMMKEQNALQQKLMEKTVEMNNQDPMKYLPLIQTVGPAIGLRLGNPGGIAGPPQPGTAQPKNELHFVDDIDLSKLSNDELMKMIGDKLVIISNKIDAHQMYRFISVIDKNPDLKGNIEKFIKLVTTVNNKPAVLDSAMAMFN